MVQGTLFLSGVLFFMSVGGCVGSDIGCTGLSEKDCLATDACTTDIGPSACSGDLCTDDMAFKGCRNATAVEISRRKKIRQAQLDTKQKCMVSKGRWIEYEMRRYGKCRCPGDAFFVKGRGCRTLRKVCAEEGGRFYPAHTFECNDEWREKHPFYCPRELSYRSDHFRRPKYARSDRALCVCQNGQPRVRGKGCP